MRTSFPALGPASSPRGISTLRRRRTRFFRDTRGGVFAETVIMMPVFVTLFWLLFYMHGNFKKAVDVAASRRAAAWNHALNGCPSALNTATIRSSSAPINAVFRGIGAVDSIIRRVPGLGSSFPGLYPRTTRYTSTTAYGNIDSTGSAATRNVTSNMELMCNERKRALSLTRSFNGALNRIPSPQGL